MATPIDAVIQNELDRLWRIIDQQDKQIQDLELANGVWTHDAVGNRLQQAPAPGYKSSLDDD